MYREYYGPIEAVDKRIELFSSRSDEELKEVMEKNKPTLWRRFIAYAFDDFLPEWLINYVAAKRTLSRDYKFIRYRTWINPKTQSRTHPKSFLRM